MRDFITALCLTAGGGLIGAGIAALCFSSQLEKVFNKYPKARYYWLAMLTEIVENKEDKPNE